MPQPERLTRTLADEDATTAAGAALAAALTAGAPEGAFVSLAGELGAGKTTLVRGLLRALGVTGAVRSPTYTLLETYAPGGRAVHHFDWYRLADAGELEALGFRDLAAGGAWLLVEWPERVPAVAAAADLALELRYAASGRVLEARAGSAAGRRTLAALAQQAL